MNGEWVVVAARMAGRGIETQDWRGGVITVIYKSYRHK